MRAVLDCTPLFIRSAGVKTYLFHLYRHLREHAGDNVRAFPPFRSLGELDLEHSAVDGSAKAAIGLAVLSNRSPFPLLNLFMRDADLFHATNIIRNPPRNARLTTTLHDFTSWIMPEFHTKANVEADMDFARKVIARADRLIAVSEATRNDAVRLLNLDPARIDVIHHGVYERYFTACSNGAGQGKPYVLNVGTVEPRKNLPRLLDAWESLPRDVRDEFDLVVAGPIGWEKPEIVERLKRGPARYLGYVSHDDLPVLTAGAVLFAYPSLYEGFGFPVAQAMASGVPVLTSDVSSLPEVAGEGALLADPRSVEDIARGLLRLLTSPSERARIAAAGRQRAMAKFRWDRCARETWATFERACA